VLLALSLILVCGPEPEPKNGGPAEHLRTFPDRPWSDDLSHNAEYRVNLRDARQKINDDGKKISTTSTSPPLPLAALRGDVSQLRQIPAPY